MNPKKAKSILERRMEFLKNRIATKSHYPIGAAPLPANDTSGYDRQEYHALELAVESIVESIHSVKTIDVATLSIHLGRTFTYYVNGGDLCRPDDKIICSSIEHCCKRLRRLR